MVGRTLAVGVIGLGRMGGRHARNLAHRIGAAEVVAVADADRALADAVGAECGGAAVFGDALALIHDAAVDAVVIASPDATHPDLAVACIEAGLPVLCEKPLGVGLDGSKRILEAEVAAGRRLVQVGLMRVYDPRHAALKQAVDDGAVGRPLLFSGIHKNRRVGRIRSAVDVLVNSGVHDVHSARWLMSDEVASAYASRVIDMPDRPESARLVLLHLAFRKGGLATIEIDVDSGYGYEIAADIAGERGTLRMPPLAGPILRRDDAAIRAVEFDALERFEAAYMLEAEAWVQAALKGTATGPSVWDGYVAMQVAEAAARSIDSGKAEAVPEEPRPEIHVPAPHRRTCAA